jgi:hypothetical protein
MGARELSFNSIVCPRLLSPVGPSASSVVSLTSHLHTALLFMVLDGRVLACPYCRYDESMLSGTDDADHQGRSIIKTTHSQETSSL